MRDYSNAIAERVARIRAGHDPLLLATLASGHAILAKQQPTALEGCCMLLPDPVVASANELGPRERERFFGDLVLLGDAVLEATGAERINYLVLCNQVPQLHGHCVPRFANEAPQLRTLDPFAAYDFASAPTADETWVQRALFGRLRAALLRRQPQAS